MGLRLSHAVYIKSEPRGRQWLLGLVFALIATVVALTVSSADAKPITILALGTSLTAGFGLPADEAFTTLLSQRLRERGYDAKVIDAGVSGDTSAGGAARLDWALAPDIDAVIVELGSNDALRGLKPADTERHLSAILDKLAQRKLPVLLAGMKAPRNLGPEYAAQFDGIYPRLARKYGSVFYPFFLDGVAAERSLNQADGIHPNAKGEALIVQRILPSVLALIARITD